MGFFSLFLLCYFFSSCNLELLIVAEDTYLEACCIPASMFSHLLSSTIDFSRPILSVA